MKYVIVVCCLMVATQINTQARFSPRSAPQDPTAQVVVQNFAQIVMHVITMAGNSHDKPTIVQNSCGIVQNIANIVQEAVKLIDQQENLSDEEIAHFVYQRLIALKVHEFMTDQVIRMGLGRTLLTTCNY